MDAPGRSNDDSTDRFISTLIIWYTSTNDDNNIITRAPIFMRYFIIIRAWFFARENLLISEVERAYIIILLQTTARDGLCCI